MTEPHPQYGCPGQWYVLVSSNTYPAGYEYGPYQGYENDPPYLANVGTSFNGSPTTSLLSPSGIQFDPTFTFVSSNAVLISSRFVRDPSCSPGSKYDCLNGSCILASVYDTPGIYSSLSECQANCGSGAGCSPPNICVPPDYCPPGMVCLPVAKWGQIEGLSSQAENKACR